MADYDISKFTPFRRSSDIVLTLYKRMTNRISIGLLRALLEMKPNRFEFLVSPADECICIRVISASGKEPSTSREHILREVNKYKSEIYSFMEVEPDEDTALVLRGEVDYTQNAIFFPKENATISELKKRKTDELQ